MYSKRSRQNRRINTSPASEVLERRSLLAAVVGSISIDGKAPDVLPPVNGVDLLSLSDDDSTRIFTTDGTQAGTVQVADIPVIRIVHHQVVGSQLFVVGVTESGFAHSLWNVSELSGQTSLVSHSVQFNDGTNANFAVLNDELYFSATSDNASIGPELFKSDGGPAELVAAFYPGLLRTHFRLQGNQGVRFEFWLNEIDPETGQLVQAKVRHIFDLPPAELFESDVPAGRYRYWIRPTNANGDVGSWSESKEQSVSGSAVLNDNPQFKVFNDELYFAARTTDGKRSLWKSDGTAAGTLQVDPTVFDVHYLNDEGPANFVEFDGQLFFSTVQGLHRTDGDSVVKIGISRDATAIGVANGRLFVNDGAHILSLASATENAFIQLHAIPETLGDYGLGRVDSFTVVDDEMVFQSVKTTATHSYNLSPSDDRHFPSSVPRFWHVKEGEWYRTDGTIAGTRRLPGPAYQYAEDSPNQRFTNLNLIQALPVGESTLIRSTTTSLLTGNEIRRLGSDGSAVLGETVLAPNGHFLNSAISDDIREENLFLQGLSDAYAIADEFWVSATNGDEGRALFQIDLDENSVAGPQIDGPDVQNVEGFGPMAVAAAGDISFSWSDQNHSTFDVKVEKVAHAFGHGTTVESLESTQQTSFADHFDAGLYRIQVRSKLADGTDSHWAELLLQVTEPQLAGPTIVSPVSNASNIEYGTVDVSWSTSGFGDAVSFEVRTSAGMVTGISTATAQPAVGPGLDSVSVRARYPDGTVSQWGTPVEFYGVSTPAMRDTNLWNNHARIYLLPSDEVRSIRYSVYEADSGQLISQNATGFGGQNDSFAVRVPHSGTYRVVARSTFRHNGQKYYSNAAEQTIAFDVEHEDSKPVVNALVQNDELQIDWTHPGAVSYDVTVSYIGDAVYGSEPIGTFEGVQQTTMSVAVPADSRQYRIAVVGYDSGGVESAEGDLVFNRKSRAGVRNIEGDGVQVTARPTITWDAPDSTYPDVSRYELLLTGVNETYRRTNIQEPSHTADADLSSDRYRVFVRAFFVDGTSSPWRESDGILNLKSPVTGPPTILSPNAITTTSRPELRWREDAEASHYEVWLSTKEDVTPIIHETAYTETSLIPEGYLPEGDYRLWVRTHYPDGTNSRWTTTYHFEVAPGRVVEVIFGTGTQPAGEQTIEWVPYAGATSYEIYVNDVTARHTPVYHVSDIQGTSHTFDASLQAGKSYEVWVRAHHSYDAISNWGRTPPILTIVGGQNATPTLQISGSTASWAAIDTATQYELWVNEIDPANGNRTIRRALRTFPTDASVPMNLPAGNYRGWVRALVGDGTWSPWSEAVTFVI